MARNRREESLPRTFPHSSDRQTHCYLVLASRDQACWPYIADRKTRTCSEVGGVVGTSLTSRAFLSVAGTNVLAAPPLPASVVGEALLPSVVAWPGPALSHASSASPARSASPTTWTPFLRGSSTTPTVAPALSSAVPALAPVAHQVSAAARKWLPVDRARVAARSARRHQISVYVAAAGAFHGAGLARSPVAIVTRFLCFTFASWASLPTAAARCPVGPIRSLAVLPTAAAVVIASAAGVVIPIRTSSRLSWRRWGAAGVTRY
jgi:hypothetical protein